MSDDPRPYPPTDWEEDESQAASDAVEDAHDAVDSAVFAAEHAKKTMSELVEISRDISATSKAVEKVTRDSVIADNKRFRRRNAVLVFLTCVLISGMGYLIYRDIYVSAPQREKITAIAEKLEECTTPGPRTPTADDPTTGHKCFDDGQARTGEAITKIVDADGNGKLDTQEILAKIEQFEIFLGIEIEG